MTHYDTALINEEEKIKAIGSELNDKVSELNKEYSGFRDSLPDDRLPLYDADMKSAIKDLGSLDSNIEKVKNQLVLSMAAAFVKIETHDNKLASMMKNEEEYKMRTEKLYSKNPGMLRLIIDEECLTDKEQGMQEVYIGPNTNLNEIASLLTPMMKLNLDQRIEEFFKEIVDSGDEQTFPGVKPGQSWSSYLRFNPKAKPKTLNLVPPRNGWLKLLEEEKSEKITFDKVVLDDIDRLNNIQDYYLDNVGTVEKKYPGFKDALNKAFSGYRNLNYEPTPQQRNTIAKKALDELRAKFPGFEELINE